MTTRPKEGKSSLIAAKLAATFRDPDHGGDTLKIHGLNTARHAVIHVDTELPRRKHEAMMQTVLRRSGATAFPPWFYSYARKGASTIELKEELEAIAKVCVRQHGGIYSVDIDGTADFVNDVNDQAECNLAVRWLERLAVEYDTSITNVIHLNPASSRDSVGKAHGHLGSQLQRKAETDIRLSKGSDGITTIFTDPQGTRGEPVLEKDGPRFSWDHDEGMHMTVLGTKQGTKDAERAEQLREIAVEVFEGVEFLRTSELISRLQKTCKLKSESAAYDKRKLMVNFGVLKNFGGQWNLAA